MQLIDRHLHGGLIHFGVHGLGCRGALAGLWAGLGWAGWAAAGGLARCAGLGSARWALELGGGRRLPRGPKAGRAFQS